MSTTIVTETTSLEGSEPTEVVTDNFKVTDIPNAMEKSNWTTSARFMRKWLNEPEYTLPRKAKSGNIPPSALPKNALVTDLPFEWLLTSSTRIKPRIEELLASLSYVNNVNPYIGHTKEFSKQLSKGLIQFMTRLSRLGYLDEQTRSLKNAYSDLSDLSAIELEEKSQFNFIRIGNTNLEKLTDDLDDVYGALGNFTIKIAATRFRTINNYKGFAKIEIDEIGLYVRDTYDFINDDDDQFLGYWNDSGAHKHYTSVKLDSIFYDNKVYLKTTNNSFNAYREITGKGGDYIVFSTVHKHPTSIAIYLNDNDLKEYIDRK